ncbi:hypothetical protein C1Y40_04105 [Mycobacterium talmoniae]|uniref:Uncharacterized protein n=1 Tax=Mycobacterium talmoniae TaxID=1858794 RepID=A0A2S8BGE3_9MYCO|nr:hypothetical protein C1Y40_04105 [Mycobacterium talmoniae]
MSIIQPTAVATVSQPSHASASRGVSPNSAPTNGTSSTVAPARVATDSRVSTT